MDHHSLLLHFAQIDVHYSLPRDDAKGGERERNQVILGSAYCSTNTDTFVPAIPRNLAGHSEKFALRQRYRR